jgi:hypothetical protein
MTLTLKLNAETVSGKTISSGSKVEYMGHVPGGMLKIKFEDVEEIIHPATTVELS